VNTMSLKAMLPTEVLLEESVVKVIAEAENSSFCLLPRHIDFTAALAPGILLLTGSDGEEQYAALDNGTLVKCGREVLIFAYNSVRGDNLTLLCHSIAERFITLDEHQHTPRSALARLEAGVVRRFMEMEEQSYG